MKRRRLLIGMALILALGALAYYGRPRAQQGFVTPAECLDAFRDACKDGDVSRYLDCLGEPLRSEKQRSVTATELVRQMEGVKSWTRHEPVIRNGAADVEVDLVRKTGTSRLSFHLQHTERGWVIVALDGPHQRTSPVLYGTPAGAHPE